jgi:hypothetical protein
MLEYLLTEDGLVPPVERVPDEGAQKPSVREEIFAVANTAHLLAQLGEDIEISPEDEAQAQDLFETGRVPNTYERTIPGVMLKLEALLTQYDYSLLEDAAKIRNFVTNKLIEETNDPDPRIRLKAYELLGKITEVGLFTERSEVLVTHRPSEDLEALLREKLARLAPKLVNPDPEPAVLELIDSVKPEDVSC